MTKTVEEVGPKKTKKPKRQSRADQWMLAVEEAKLAFADLETARDNLDDKLQVLRDIQTEYEEWRDNLPENLQSSALGERLDAVCEIDIESQLDHDLTEIEGVLNEAEALDLPQGFGRD